MTQNGPKIVFFRLVFPGNNLKWRLVLLLIFCYQSYIWQNSQFSSYGPKFCRPIKLQDSLKCNISRKEGMMKFIFGMHRFGSVLGVQSQECLSSLQYFSNILRKIWRIKLTFSCRQTFFDNIILGVCGQACPNYSK